MTLACISSPRPCSRIANSSPPRRAMASPGQARLETPGHFDEQFIANEMTKAVVDDLKRSRSRYSVAKRPVPRAARGTLSAGVRGLQRTPHD